MTVETEPFWQIIADNRLDVPALNAAADPRLKSALMTEIAHAHKHPDNEIIVDDVETVLAQVIKDHKVTPHLKHAVMNYCEEGLEN